jgi:ubiquinone/menaquinone biosynthesis C-methylase UbiE
MSLESRVLEPEVMDSPEEAVDYDAMDHGEVNHRFVSDFLAVWIRCRKVAVGEVLDLGTGTAQIPIELCRKSPELRVLGIDLAEQMLMVGRQNVDCAGMSGQIKLQRLDAKALQLPDGSFAAVISNSIVHHIPQPAAVLAEAVRVLAPGGLLFVRDLMRPKDEAELRLLVDTYTAGAIAHQRQMFEDSLRAALTINEIRTIASDLGLDPAAVQATSDRHWTLAVWKQ